MRIAFLLAVLASLTGCAGTLAPEKSAKLVGLDLYGQVTSVVDARKGGFLPGSNYCNTGGEAVCQSPDDYDVVKVMLVRDSWGSILPIVPVQKKVAIKVGDIIEYHQPNGQKEVLFVRAATRSDEKDGECKWDGSTLFTSGGVVCKTGYSYKNLPISGPVW